jgi:tyrosine-protein kinase Etk/Wzc
MKRETTMQAEAADTTDGDVNLIALLRNVALHARLFAAITAAILLLSIAYLLAAKPTYMAQALIQVDEDQGAALGALSDVASALSLNKPIDGELDILGSRTVLTKAIAQTQAQLDIQVHNSIPVLGRLYARFATPPNGLAPVPLGLDGFAWGGERLRLDEFQVPSTLNTDSFRLLAGADGTWTLQSPDALPIARGRVGERVAFTVDTRFGPGTGSIRVRALRARPGTRFDVSKSSLQQTLDAVSRHIKIEETSKDSSMIRLSVQDRDGERAADVANALAQAYMAMNIRHRAQQAHLSLQFLGRKLPQFQAELTRSEDALNAYRMQTDTIDVEQQTEALLARSVELTRQQTLVELNLQANAQQFRAAHPTMRMLAAQKASLADELARVNTEIRTLPGTQQSYLRLARDVAVNTQIYTALVANKLQLEVAEAGTTGNVSIIDVALTPEKRSWPLPLIVLAGGLFGGALIAFVSVQVVAGLHGALRDPLELERVSQVPVYAVIPASAAQTRMTRAGQRERQPHNPLLASQFPSDPSVEALRSLRSTFKFAVNNAGSNTVLFTGPTENVGKTFVAANFAYLLALSGARVLIVDGDMRRAGLGRYFPAALHAPGLADVLTGDLPLEQAIAATAHANLDILPSGRHTTPNPGELLERPALAALLEQVGQRYDYVIVDSPPVLPIGDAITLARSCSAVFVVSRFELSNGRQLGETFKRLQQIGASITGQVFNGFRSSRYGYGYGYGYGDSGGKH